jgi:hypothetical protein
MHPCHSLHRVLIAAALTGLALGAAAHDTWFEPLPPGRTGELRLALGTGNLFPRQEFAIDAKYLVRQGCHSAGAGVAAAVGRVGALRALGNTATALHLQAPLAARSCWAQIQPFELTLAPELISVYLDEINAPADLRATWAALQARGLPWQETYTKHARINLGGVTAQSAAPSGMAMDMLMLSAAGPLRVRDKIVVQVLRESRPLAGFNVELRSDVSPQGQWHLTDGDGRVTLQPPAPGRWVLRGTDLALSATRPDEWESRFVTLAFEVAPALPASADTSTARLP